jgi:hypothetical protein
MRARPFFLVGFDFYQFDFAPDEPSQTWHVVLNLGGMSVTGRRKLGGTETDGSGDRCRPGEKLMS